MGCCNPKTSSPLKRSSRKEDVVLRVPGASAYIMQDTVVVLLAKGSLTVVQIVENDVVLAAVVEIGSGLRWPLTKDEPVVKLDRLHYLFTLPDKDAGGGFLNYGVSFAPAAAGDGGLAALDAFLKENACFSAASDGLTSSEKLASSSEVYWKDFAPRVDDYNGILAKGIAQGTGEIVKGIFKISSVYANQVQKGAALFQPQSSSISNAALSDERGQVRKEHGEINKTIRRARKLSEMTEKISKSLLDGVVLITGSVAAPLVQSKAGQSFLNSLPGEVILASLAAVDKVMDAVEAAERKALAATSGAVAGAVSKRFGENAGDATEDAFATAGHAIGTAMNIVKIRKAINPSSYRSSMVKNAINYKK